METENILPNAPLKDVLAKATAYKQGAVLGAGAGLLISLLLVKGKYVLCTFGGALIGGYFNYKWVEQKQTPPTFVNYGTAEPVQPVVVEEPITQNTNSNSLQNELINSADGK